MNSNAPFSVDRDDRLAEVLDAYLAAHEAGTPPDVDEFLARYPELAGELRECLASLAFIRRAGNLSVAGDSPTEGESAGGVLGDFRILREVGRGGMGVVYEAEQISLRRRVALKVLPFAATMDPRHLQRFHNEAQAAACLHHTNIVPVYFVGSERGVHFYAMQFIDGQPLSEIIRQLCRLEKKAPSAGEVQTVAYEPSPDEAASTPLPAAEITPLTSEGHRSRDYFRKVTELGVQAAEALDHAHELGIVHRDIKPANLLLDGRGNLWVTDFGLAHVQHGEASLTGTGQMVGTPRYMSPEQALAKRAVIDHRTDIYSLGATLYELLTLQPAFGGEDREELLRQIAFEEPVKPRRLERAIPAELEIIVLKAMEKRPQDRYVTSQELADDLRRWLEDRPIRARRPSWGQVARKWSRRHQAAVLAALLLLVALLVFGFGFSLWWVRHQTAAETEAQAALEEAKRWQKKERWSEALSAIHRAQGVLRGFGTNASLCQQIDELGKDLEMAERLEKRRLQYSRVAYELFDTKEYVPDYGFEFKWYGLDVANLDVDTVAEYIRSRSIRSQLVAALEHWSMAKRSWKHQEWNHLLAVARAADPHEWRNRFRDAWERGDGKAMNDVLASLPDPANLLPTTLRLLWFFYYKVGKVSSDRVIALSHLALRMFPDDFWTSYDLAMFLMTSQPPQLEEAIGYFRVANALRPYSPGVLTNLSKALKDKGRLVEALHESQSAIEFSAAGSSAPELSWWGGRLDEAIAQYRRSLRFNEDRRRLIQESDAAAHKGLGDAVGKKGRTDEAIAEYRKAIQIKKDYAEAHCNLGNLLKDTGQLDEAIAECREAIRINMDRAKDTGQLDEAIAKFPEAKRININRAAAHKASRLHYQSLCVPAHKALGDALSKKGRLDEAIAEYREAIRVNKDFSAAHLNLGYALHNKGKLDEGIAEIREAIRLDGIASYNPGTALYNKGRLDEAIAYYRETIRIMKDHSEAHHNIGNALVVKGRLDEAITEYREAIRLRKDCASVHNKFGNALKDKGRVEEATAAFREANQPFWPNRLAECLHNAEGLMDLEPRLPALLKGQEQPKDARERLILAWLCEIHKQFLAATRWYGEAFAAQPELAEDLDAAHRFDAACSAALAGCGLGKDTGKLSDKECARLRRQALDWLRADWKAYQQMMDEAADKAGPIITQRMQHWLKDGDFAGVRGVEALAKLPAEERSAWRKLWADVAELLAKAQGKSPAEKKRTRNNRRAIARVHSA